MNKLDKLISKIDSFCTQALCSLLLIKKGAEPQGYYMPDDPEEENDTPEPMTGEDVGKYNELLHVAQQVRDPGLSSELILLAELYRKSIEIGGGYNSINRSIHNIINMYLEDEEDPQQEEIEDILNEVVSDLRKRAGGAAGLAKPDSPGAIKALKEMKDNFNSQNLQQEVYDLSNYDETASSTFDPTGGVGKEEAGKGFGRGHSFTTRKSLKDWISHYENEIQRYADLLNSVTNVGIKDKIKTLLDILNKLKANTVEENKLAEAYSTTNDEETGTQLNKVKEENKKLKQDRTSLKQGIRNIEISRSINTLQESLNNTRNADEKDRLQQEIDLLKLVSSKDIGKTEERNWRRILLKSMSGGNKISLETRQKLEENIQKAAAKKKSYDQYQKEIAEDIKNKKESKSLEGLIIQLKQHIPNIKMGDKKDEVDKWRAEIISKNSPEHKSYLDAIAAAKIENNKNTIKNIMSELYTHLNNNLKNNIERWKLVTERHKDIENRYADVELFKKRLIKLFSENSVIQNRDSLLEDVQKLINKSYPNPWSGEERKSTKPILQAIKDKLDEGKQNPAVLINTKKEANMSIKQRKNLLEQLTKEALLDTGANEINQILNDASLDQIQDPQEYAKQIFIKLVNQVANKEKNIL